MKKKIVTLVVAILAFIVGLIIVSSFWKPVFPPLKIDSSDDAWIYLLGS